MKNLEMAVAGTIEKLGVLLAIVKLVASNIAPNRALKFPSLADSEWLADPKDMIDMPIKAPTIVIKTLKLIFSFKNIFPIIAANIGDVLKINSALATEVSSIEAINNKLPKPCVIIKIMPLIPGFFTNIWACFL